MIQIKQVGTSAKAFGEIPKALDTYLLGQFAWLNPVDLTQEIFFYHEGVMRTGIAQSVCKEIVASGLQCELVLDELPEREFSFCMKEGFAPRDFQIDGVNALHDHRFGFLSAPPGAGKTVAMALLTQKFGLRTAIVVNNKEPFSQAYSTFERFTDFSSNVGRISGEFKQLGPVTIYTIQALNRALQRKDEIAEHFLNSKVCFIDEAHHVAANSYANIVESLRRPYSICGFTATPFRDDSRDSFLEALIGPVLYHIPYSQGIDEEFLVPCTIYVERMEAKEYGYINPEKSVFQKRAEYAKVYKDYVINNTKRNRAGIKMAREAMGEGLSVVMIVSKIEHANSLHALLPEAQIITGKTPKKQREKILEDFRTHKVNVVISTVFDEAVDVPSLGLVCLMAGGKSSVKLIQRLRSLRAYTGKLHDGSTYNKDRGYVWYPRDKADYLTSHSTTCVGLLKEFAQQHKDNEFIEL